MKRQTKGKIYTYLPYDDEQSFEKVQSSNSRPRTCAASVQNLKELSQYSQNRAVNPNNSLLHNIQQQYGRDILPLDSPKLWNTNCIKCSNKISEIGSALRINIEHHQKIKKIIPLPNKQPSLGLSYAVQYQDSRYQKFTSKALFKWYLPEMVNFLQNYLFQK